LRRAKKRSPESRRCASDVVLTQGGGFRMCSGSEAGSYLRLIDFVYHSTLGLRVIKKREEDKVPG